MVNVPPVVHVPQVGNPWTMLLLEYAALYVVAMPQYAVDALLHYRPTTHVYVGYAAKPDATCTLLKPAAMLSRLFLLLFRLFPLIRRVHLVTISSEPVQDRRKVKRLSGAQDPGLHCV